MQVAFFKGNRPGINGTFNHVCKWWLRGDFSHSELIFTDGYCGSSSFLDGGVRIKRISNFDPNDWLIYSNISGNEYIAREFIESQEGKPFDTRGLSGHVLRRIPQNKEKWFCSELIMAALFLARGINPIDVWRFDPCAFEYLVRIGFFS